MTRSTLVRIGLVIAVVALWLYTRAAHPAWTESLMSTASRWPWAATWWVGGIAAILLVAGAIFMLVPMPSRHSATDDAMGRGCAEAGAVGLGAVALILALAMMFRIRWLIHAIGLGTLVIAVVLILGLITEAIKAMRKRAESRRDASTRAGENHVE